MSNRELITNSLKLKQNDSGYWYFDVARESYGRGNFSARRLWINRKLVKDGYIEFPLKAQLIRTEKGNYVLRPSDNHVTLHIGWECGYRGSSTWEYEYDDNTDYEFFEYEVYHSPRGNLGISGYVIACFKVPNEVTIYLKRDGRLYGDEEQKSIVVNIDENGVIDVKENIDTDLENLLD